MFVIKRKGHKVPIKFDKIQVRLERLINESGLRPLKNINLGQLCQDIVSGLYDGISTSEIDNFAADKAFNRNIEHPDYDELASRILIDNHHKNTLDSFYDKTNTLHMLKDEDGNFISLLDDKYYKYVKLHKRAIQKLIDYRKDFSIDYFGFRTLERSYLMRDGNRIIERPQDLFMRVAVFIHMNTCKDFSEEIKMIEETYQFVSDQFMTHASPTLFNAGSRFAQLASCFLMQMGDSRKDIMRVADEASNISKFAGGIGIAVSAVRGPGAKIRSTNGPSNGLIPYLKILNDVARAFNQGGKRLGSFSAFIEPWHPDILAFLSIKRPHGDENQRARDLFMGCWTNDLFMERVVLDEKWSLFDPDRCRGLQEAYGEEFEALYRKYEAEGKQYKVVNAREIFTAIRNAMEETGIPYIGFKDPVNELSMQKNLGTIKSSNLCHEIMEFTSEKETAVCNLASICLSKCVKDKDGKDDEYPLNPYFDFDLLVKITQHLVINLNKIIDKNYYPDEKTRLSNLSHRPIGIGVQGLANVFAKMRYPFNSDKAKKLNKMIFETIQYATLSQSCNLARENYLNMKRLTKAGKKVYRYRYDVIDNEPILLREIADIKDKTIGAYPSYNYVGKFNAPIKTKFHWEGYNEFIEKRNEKYCKYMDFGKIPKAVPCGKWNWETLRDKINVFGVYNSLTVALMPTASTSQIMGNNECFEPFTDNLYKRNTLAGSFPVINKYLVKDLINLGIWNKEMRDYIILSKGSIQKIDGIPQDIKDLYKTVYDISQLDIIEMASDRQPWVDQAQSMNLHIKDITGGKVFTLLKRGWLLGLKTGVYYTRSKTIVDPQPFTIDPETQKKILENLQKESTQDLDIVEESACIVCSS